MLFIYSHPHILTWIPGKIITRSVERLINQCFLVKPRYKYL